MTIDIALQTQVDTQILEQGAFAPLEFLIDSGRLVHGDYEDWRRRQIESLDEVLMGSKEKIRAQLESAIGYARSIGLVEQPQTFYAWVSHSPTGSATGRGTSLDHADTPLRISSDAVLAKLIAGRYVPAQSAPQMDLFFDNPVVALTNGIARSLSARNLGETQRQLDRLYAQAPNHADLAAFDRLLEALRHLDQPVIDAPQELEFLLSIAPTARRLLGWEARDLLTPLWQQLAEDLKTRPYVAGEPNLHKSFAFIQALDWVAASAAVQDEPDWWSHPPLCLRLATSSFYQQRRTDALTAWFHLCWRAPEQAAESLDNPRQPDTGIKAQWQRFMDCEEDPPLTPVDFPAWLLLREPGLNLQLAINLPTDTTPGEENYRCVHRWIDARRAKRTAEEITLRKMLQALSPALFRQLKLNV
jgi:hypothetical protein